METALLPALPLLLDRTLWSPPTRRRSSSTREDEVKDDDRVGKDRVGLSFSRGAYWIAWKGRVSVVGRGGEGWQHASLSPTVVYRE